MRACRIKPLRGRKPEVGNSPEAGSFSFAQKPGREFNKRASMRSNKPVSTPYVPDILRRSSCNAKPRWRSALRRSGLAGVERTEERRADSNRKIVDCNAERSLHPRIAGAAAPQRRGRRVQRCARQRQRPTGYENRLSPRQSGNAPREHCLKCPLSHRSGAAASKQLLGSSRLEGKVHRP